MALLEIDHVTRRFGHLTAVDDISLSIEAGEFFTLLGPSGCGKTTLLRMIAGFDLPDAGSIRLSGRDLASDPPERRPVRTVFQSYALFPHMTVAGNVAFPLKMANATRAEVQTQVRQALASVRLDDKADRYPHELSGGQKQRVAIARALISQPRILLLDEPLAALDAKLREQMQVELMNLQKAVGISFVYVTHDQTEALALSHRIAVMNHGRLEQLDVPSELYRFPRTRFVADFIGHCNLLEGTLLATDRAGKDEVLRMEIAGLGEVKMRTNRDTRVAATGCMAIRPEQVEMAQSLESIASENRFAGHVSEILYMGDVTLYAVTTTGGARIEALTANAAPGRARLFDIGDAVEVAWSIDAGHYIAS